MTQDRIENLLMQADRAAGPPAPVAVSLSTIRRRANRRSTMAAVASVAAAAVLIAAIAILSRSADTRDSPQPEKRIASLEDQIRQLQATTDATLSLVREVLDNESRQRRLDELQAKLAAIADPREEIRTQIDKTVFTLVYQADRLYYELNQADSAVEAYNQVIMYFPKNRWADVARKRLEDINKAKL